MPDAVWDRFVAIAGDGLYQQTTMWAQVKALVGWQAERLVVEREGRVVGGCQLLIRSLPVVGAVAYAPRGPVIPDRDMAVLDLLLASLHRLARKRRIRYLALQPPPGRHDLASVVETRGFVESDIEIAPRATVRIDLQRSTEALFGAMREATWRNVRRAQRLEVTVREGSQADLRYSGSSWLRLPAGRTSLCIRRSITKRSGGGLRLTVRLACSWRSTMGRFWLCTS